MNITLSEVVVIAAGILTVMNLIDKILAWKKTADAPDKERMKSIELKEIQLEQKLVDHDQILSLHAGFFDNDKKRIDLLERGNRVTSKALLALLGHMNSGNNETEMQEAEKDLRKYLIER